MTKTVIVATGTNLGWDCVVGVFDSMGSVRRSHLTEDLDHAELGQMTDADLEAYLTKEFEIVLHDVALESYK